MTSRERPQGSLVEDEGVNAAGGAAERETLAPPAASTDGVRRGGRPEGGEGSDRPEPAHGLVGPPAQDGEEPGQELSAGEA